MTRSQQIYLMQLWKKVCETQRWDPKDDVRRHRIYEQTLGRAKRFSEFSNADFDKVKAAFLFLCDRIQGAIEVDHPEIGESRRYIWLITRHPEAYWTPIARDKFGSDDIQRLSVDQLTQLLVTITARCRSLASEIKALRPFGWIQVARKVAGHADLNNMTIDQLTRIINAVAAEAEPATSNPF